jgi:hypothetical protein
MRALELAPLCFIPARRGTGVEPLLPAFGQELVEQDQHPPQSE